MHPADCAAAYAFLRQLLPFRRLRVPPADAVRFQVGTKPGVYGWHRHDGEHCIYVSSRVTTDHTAMLQTVAHEMIHLHLWEADHVYDGGNVHDAAFTRIARRACKPWAWDLDAFIGG